LWLRVAPGGAIEWLCRDAQGRVSHGPGHCADDAIPAWPRVDDIVVVWADESLLLRRAALPTSGRAKWRTGLPYLAEDWVAGDVGELHVVAPQSLAGKDAWVGVIERRLLDDLLARLRAFGVTPDHVVPEAALLGPGRAADVLLDAGHASFATDSGLGGGCEADLFPVLIDEPLETLRVVSTEASPTAAGPVEVIDSALRWVSLQSIDDRVIDLLQGRYAPPGREHAGGGWWRIAGRVALVAVVVHTLALAVEVYSIQRTEAALEAELEVQFRRVFGADQRMVNPAFQIRSEFSRLGPAGAARAEALALLKGLAPLLTADSRLVLQGFVYADGALEVAVRAPDATRFEGLREQVMLDPGLQVEIGSTSYVGKEVIGRIRIRRNA
jgi:type II secretion system protein L